MAVCRLLEQLVYIDAEWTKGAVRKVEKRVKNKVGESISSNDYEA